jgi:hypothetical protein
LKYQVCHSALAAGRGCDGSGTGLVIFSCMNPNNSVAFDEASQAFTCDRHYANNFAAFLDVNSLYVESPGDIEPVKTITGEKRALLEPLDRKLADALIARFLAADDKIKARRR